MPLYEFILRVPGRPDEVRISDTNGFSEGDAVVVDGRRWIVAAVEPTTITRPDSLRVEERIVMVRAAADEP